MADDIQGFDLMIYTLCVIATSSRTRPRPLSAINHALNLHTKNTQSVDCVFCFITLLLIIRPQILICAVVVILRGISVISAVIIWGVIIVVVADVIVANI